MTRTSMTSTATTDATIRTTVRSGGVALNHSETATVCTSLRSGLGIAFNHGETMSRSDATIRTAVRSGGVTFNHNESATARSVRSGVRAGGLSLNHTARPVRSGVRAGGVNFNHNAVIVRSAVRAGGIELNHNVVTVRSAVRAGGVELNHAERTAVAGGRTVDDRGASSAQPIGSASVKTQVKVGGPLLQHNEVAIRSGVRGGAGIMQVRPVRRYLDVPA